MYQLFGVVALLDVGKCGIGSPLLEGLQAAFGKGGEFRVRQNGGFDLAGLYQRLFITGAAGGEQGGPQGGEYLPVGAQGFDVPFGDTAFEVGAEVVQVFWFRRVDIARDVEVVVVGGDVAQGHHAAVARQFDLLGEHVDDLVDVLAAQAVFVAILHVALAGIDHKDAFAGVGVFLVDDDNAGGDAGAVKQVGGQADDAFDVALFDEVFADAGFGVTPEQHAVGQDDCAFAGAFQ